MRTRFPILAAAVILVGAAGAALFHPSGVAATPPSDIAASYSGKGVSKTHVLSGDLEGGTGGFLLNAYASQEGSYLYLTLVIDPDGDSQVWELQGRVGNGRFWASGPVGEGEYVTLTGTARGSDGKLSLKATGVFTASDHYSDLKFAVKQVLELK